jgi:hypothetical protein
MKLGPIVLLLRTSDTSFDNRIAGAAELDTAFRNTLTQESAFVIPLAEDAPINDIQPGVSQKITERFGVVVALKTDTSQSRKLGLSAYDRLHDIRNELFAPLVGLDLGYEDLIYYRGARLLDMHRGYLWYQFEFEYTSRASIDAERGIGVIETRPVQDRQQVSQLPDLDDVFTQYILHPSVKWDDLQAENPGGVSLPVNAQYPDMETIVDFTDNPYDGPFASAFRSAFDVDYNK